LKREVGHFAILDPNTAAGRPVRPGFAVGVPADRRGFPATRRSPRRQAELHVWPGCFHGFDAMVPQAAISQEGRAARVR
jgi:hypothetical protein